MTDPSPVRRPSRRTLGTALAGTVALVALAGGSALAASPSSTSARVGDDERGRAASGSVATSAPEARGSYDVREGATSAARLAQERLAGRVSRSPEARRLTDALGASVILDIDGTTGTVRQVADLAGHLTGAGTAPPAAVALSFVRAHHDALGLTASDLATFRLRRDYVDVVGTHHLSWVQLLDGTQVFGNGLTAAVDRTGRLLTVGGSPVTTPAPLPRLTAPEVAGPDAAIRAALALSGDAATTPGADDTATPVAVVAGGRSYRAWSTSTTSGAHPALTVVDAASGRLLYRRSLSSDAAGEAPVTRAPLAAYRSLIGAPAATGAAPTAQEAATPTKTSKTKKPKKGRAGTGRVITYFPQARRGGQYRTIDFAKRGWVGLHPQRLTGNNAHAWSDTVDDNRAQANEEVHPTKAGTWNRELQPFKLKGVSFCGAPYPCSWNPDKPYSWKTNRAQDAIQVFYFVNNWHDHLGRSPIGFTEAAGNFQVKNATKKGKGDDAVRTQTDDGANTDHGLPDGAHIDNANMNTPPDGQAPTMQMYLQHQPGSTYPDGDPFAPTNVGDEADTVYHEYTHGLSNRLVVDASGQSTLGNVQAGAMGEAWSDWYAMDYLVDQGLQPNMPGVADVVLFQYDGQGVFLDRTEPIDCDRGTSSPRCTGGLTGHTGGYTYADYARVGGGAEVHSDGEIWAQTLWSLRGAIGSKVSESIVTRAMELAPANPSFLDMRDAILLADTSAYAGKHRAAIWRVFANRGMGFYAGSLGGDDTAPAADFHTAQSVPGTGTITGTVTDADSGAPVAGAVVTLKFQGGGAANPTATTGADGTYTLGPVPAGHYRALVLSAPGFVPVTNPVDVAAGTTTADATIRRDWAASTGGATVDAFTGPDFGPACGPDRAIDLSPGAGWGTTTGDDAGDPTNVFVPKSITVKLPAAVDVSGFGVDPTANCGDGGSASTGQYRIETSADGTVYTEAATGTFVTADRGQVDPVPPTGPQVGVRYVRFTILGNQTPNFATSCPGGSFSGCSYTDLTELEVFGSAS